MYDVIEDAHRNPLYLAEREFLAQTECLVFVVDSQPARTEATLAAFNYYRDVFTRLGRNPNEIPVVFQLNKRDLPGIYTEARLMELLQWPLCTYISTVATQGVGIAAMMTAAVQLGERGRCIRRRNAGLGQ